MQQDNAKPKTAKKTKDKFEELNGDKVLLHVVYSPDSAPSDYDLFRLEQHFLEGHLFDSLD